MKRALSALLVAAIASLALPAATASAERPRRGGHPVVRRVWPAGPRKRQNGRPRRVQRHQRPERVGPPHRLYQLPERAKYGQAHPVKSWPLESHLARGWRDYVKGAKEYLSAIQAQNGHELAGSIKPIQAGNKAMNQATDELNAILPS